MKYIHLLFLGCLLALTQSTVAQYFTGGNTQSLGQNCFRLTDSVPNQWGKLWYDQQIDLTQPFELYASVNFGTRDTTGGDGIAFSFHQGGLLAGSGGSGSLGYQNISPSLTVEMDTRQNSAYSDPAFDHIGLTSGGSLNHSGPGNVVGPFTMDNAGSNVEDTVDHALHVKWDPSSNNLKVWFDCDLRIDYTGNIINQFFQGYPLVYWGFTASNSSNAYNQHSVCIEYLSLEPLLNDTTLCQGTALQLNAGLGAQYQWSPSAGLTDDTIRNPIAIPQVNTTYTVTVTDSCGYARTESYTHSIIDSNLATLSGDTVTCAGNPIELGLNVSGTAPFNIAIFDGTGSTNYNLDSNGNDITTGLPPMVNPTTTTTYFITGFQGGNFCGTAFSGSQTITIGILNGMVVTEQDATCNNACNGAASIFIPHETPAYSYVWPNFTGGNSKPGLCAGTYMVTVNDGNGCIDSVQVDISEPAPIAISSLGPYTACRNQPVSIPLAPTGGSGNYVYQWSDGQTGNPGTFADTSTRNYTVSVTDDNNCPPAVQTFTINRTPALTVEAANDTGMCIGEIIPISAQGLGGDNNYSYVWSTGETQPFFLSDTNQTTTYVVTVTDGCGSPPVIDSMVLTVDTFRTHTYTFNDPACIKDPIEFTIDNYDPTARYTLSYGDGNMQVVPGASVEHFYEDTGRYHITLLVESAYCDSVRTDSNAVNLLPSPTARFNYSPDSLFVISDYTVTLRDSSSLASRYDWYINDAFVGSGRTLEYSFSDSGIYDAKLVVADTTGCLDSTLKEIRVLFENRNVFLPNAFTPNGDGLNDSFGPVIMERDISEYNFRVFSRYGNIVFETDDPLELWNGQDQNSGGEAMQGVYVYQIVYTDLNFIIQEYKGKVTLIR
jgi:gliding motility-associated-like protein